MKRFKKMTILLNVFAVLMFLFTACEQANIEALLNGSNADSVSSDSSNSTSTNRSIAAYGSVKEHYSKRGPYSPATTSLNGFSIYHPRTMGGNHPIITWGNGTGAPTFSYSPFLNHLASWGFVVVASNSVMTGSGQQMKQGIDLIISENGKAGSKFNGKIDTESIGTTGHSQGGGGAINAATDPRVLCTAPLSPAPGSIRQVKCPTFMMTGTADFLSSIVRSMSWGMATAPTILGVIKGANHMTFAGNIGKARPYVTAWFMHYLQGDDAAGEAFVKGGELFTDPDWEVQSKNF